MNRARESIRSATIDPASSRSPQRSRLPSDTCKLRRIHQTHYIHIVFKTAAEVPSLPSRENEVAQ